jgi:hypothetical protein
MYAPSLTALSHQPSKWCSSSSPAGCEQTSSEPANALIQSCTSCLQTRTVCLILSPADDFLWCLACGCSGFCARTAWSLRLEGNASDLNEKTEKSRILDARVCKPHGHQFQSRASFRVYSGHRIGCCSGRAACRCIYTKLVPVDNLITTC